MKKIGYWILAGIYNLSCMFCSVKQKKIVLLNGHNHGLNGNLLEVYEEMKKRSSEYNFIMIAKRDLFKAEGKGKIGKILTLIKGSFHFFAALPYHMATAEKVFLNDNFIPMAYMKTEKRKTQFIQLWHGAGAFKRFGLSTESDPKVYQLVEKANQKITHLFVTSKQVVPYYEEAFAIKKEKIYPIGIPVTDLYFDDERISQRKERVYQQYPELRKYKLLLYAPTFRNEAEENQQILKQFDVSKIHEILGEEWLILVKMHPKFPVENIIENDYCYNMTGYNDISDLYLVADMLITDYSSTVVEYSLLDKPVIMFAYDLQKYDRGFYYDYESMVPGTVAHSQQELFEILEKKLDKVEKRHNFVKFQYDNIKGKVCPDILDVLE